MITLGMIAYDAFCKAQKYQYASGTPLPHFGALGYAEQQAWEAAAKAVSEQIRLQTSPG